MCDRLLPNRKINRIRYFTARIAGHQHDPQAPDRQDIYIRALHTIPNLTIHYGRFAKRTQRAHLHPLTYPNGPSNPPESVEIIRTEEKRSDVNLSTMLLIDCFDDDFEEAVVISNDSDLTLPIKYVVQKFNKNVGVISPHPRQRISRELVGAATWNYNTINKSVIACSQFPDDMSDAKGAFRKPDRW